ncbi:MAG: hypothetical protein ACERLG_01900 [Sedimentibacter sp.]
MDTIYNKKTDKKRQYKKWNQLKMKDQIIASYILRNFYITFVLQNDRQPNSCEKILIVANAFSELEEKNIFVKDNEINKYLKKKISDFTESADKLR